MKVSKKTQLLLYDEELLIIKSSSSSVTGVRGEGRFLVWMGKSCLGFILEF